MLAFSAPAPPSSLRSEDVLGHLERTVAWYRSISSDQPANATAADLLLRESTRQSALQAVRLAFQFARAEVVLLGGNAPPGTAPAAGSSLQQAEQKAEDRVNRVQASIAETDAAIPKASGKQRATLTARRGELSEELSLAKEIQNTIQDMIHFSGTVGGSGLTGKINELERSIPEAQPAAIQKSGAQNAPPAKATTTAAAFDAETASLFALAGELLSMHSSESQLRSLLGDTDSLLSSIDQLKVPLVNEARTSIQHSDDIAAQTAPLDAQQLTDAQHQLSALTARFKQLSTAIVPLGDEGIAVGTARGNLSQELNELDARYRDAGRYLVVRTGTLGIVIAIVLFISELWRRATLRYVHDSRRRRQFSVLRRIVVGFAITLAIVMGFVAEMGSLATYAGFVTAGLALALQNVILSIVAYFFLIGRYGIRVGDRITISNVTGDVIDIGLVRLSMMELGPDLNSTGRVVVYSNSVIFQPSALFKQIPGINYVWHSVILTLTEDSDFQIAEKKLNQSVDSVYQKYRPSLEKQHASFEMSEDINLVAPKPESRLRFTGSGLVFTVRYPAEMKEASATDDEIMKALWDAVEGESALKFAPSGTPKIQM